MNEQSRINAMISYFFLGPLFLLAKSGTPLRDPFVRGHAVRSSSIIAIGVLVFLIYTFLIRSLFDFALFGLHIHTIIFSILSIVMIYFLMRGAYSAYHGMTAEYSGLIEVNHIFEQSPRMIPLESEEEKIRTIASIIPLLGIYIAHRYPLRSTLRGRVIGSSLMSLLIIVSIFSSEGGLLLSITVIVSILIFVILSVNILLRGQLIFAHYWELLPTYDELEAHLFASIGSMREFFRIVFGGSDRAAYHTLFIHEISQMGEPIPPRIPYFMPASLIAIPLWNLFTLPSLWIEKYREYRPLIVSGLLITGIAVLLIVTGGTRNPYLLFLLFPIVHILVYAASDVSTAVPGIHILLRLFGMAQRKTAELQTEHAQGENIHYEYAVSEKKLGGEL